MRIIAFALVSLLLISHSALPQPSDLKSRLDAAEQRWKRAALSSYEYTFSFRAFYRYVDCEGDSIRAKVVNGIVAPASDCRALRDSYATVPQLFNFVRKELAQKPDHIEVTFDSELGYPTSFGVDPRGNRSDDEFYFEVSGFVSGDALE
jgi:hypothetical protein